MELEFTGKEIRKGKLTEIVGTRGNVDLLWHRLLLLLLLFLLLLFVIEFSRSGLFILSTLATWQRPILGGLVDDRLGGHRLNGLGRGRRLLRL